MSKAMYTDSKGRRRWVRNDEVADIIKKLGEYLIIGGYPEQHAARYAQIANTVSRWPESIDQMAATDSLDSIPGVGGVITGYLLQIINTGTTEKFSDDQYGTPPPISVLELTTIERLGPKTARMLYQDHGIDSMASLVDAFDQGRLHKVKGLGPKMLDTINQSRPV